MPFGQKYFCHVWSPHLLKNVRNNFKKSGFVVEKKRDKMVSCRKFLCNWFLFANSNGSKGDSQAHWTSSFFSNMLVCLAAQVLSHSVAAGMSTLYYLGKMESRAMETAKFIERLIRYLTYSTAAQWQMHSNTGVLCMRIPVTLHFYMTQKSGWSQWSVLDLLDPSHVYMAGGSAFQHYLSYGKTWASQLVCSTCWPTDSTKTGEFLLDHQRQVWSSWQPLSCGVPSCISCCCCWLHFCS